MSELEETADHLVVIGRGRMVADTSVADLVAGASGTRVLLRTSQRTDAMTLLAQAGATVAAIDHDAVTVDGLPGERVAALLGAANVPFSELGAHRATLEEAYMELTRDAVEFGAQERGAAGVDPMTYSSTVPSRGAGFAQALRAEWTKLRSLRSTWICVALTIGLTILLAVLAGKGNSTDANKFGPPRFFAVQLVHQSLDGDGSIVAHVAEQEETGPDAKAGLMISAPLSAPGADAGDKQGPGPEPAYAAIMVTPGNGVQWQADFTHEASGSTGPAPRWLKLTRVGNRVTGYESPDGETWTQVGTTELAELPRNGSDRHVRHLPAHGHEDGPPLPHLQREQPRLHLEHRGVRLGQPHGGRWRAGHGFVAEPGHQRTTARAAGHQRGGLLHRGCRQVHRVGCGRPR